MKIINSWYIFLIGFLLTVSLNKYQVRTQDVPEYGDQPPVEETPEENPPEEEPLPEEIPVPEGENENEGEGEPEPPAEVPAYDGEGGDSRPEVEQETTIPIIDPGNNEPTGIPETEAPEVPEVPEVTEAPEVPEVPEVTEAPEVPLPDDQNNEAPIDPRDPISITEAPGSVETTAAAPETTQAAEVETTQAAAAEETTEAPAEVPTTQAAVEVPTTQAAAEEPTTQASAEVPTTQAAEENPQPTPAATEPANEETTIITAIQPSSEEPLVDNTKINEGSGDVTASVTVPTLVCELEQFICDNKCMDNSKKCDGNNDCEDRQDEADCSTDKGEVPTVTLPPFVTGAIPTTTVPIGDGIQLDCPENVKFTLGREFSFTCNIRSKADEIEYLVYRNQEAILQGPGKRVDFRRENAQEADGGEYVVYAFTPDRSVYSATRVQADFETTQLTPTAPRPCGEGEATCRNGQCIPRSGICDDKPDCDDKSDESNCPITGSGAQPKDGVCEANERLCSDGSKCIQKYWVCDGEKDCPDGSDEANCTKTESGDCGATQFQCNDRQQCIPRAFVCDGESDCGDRSDEYGCSAPTILDYLGRNIDFYIGATVIIICQARGFPAPYINFRHNWGHVCAEPRCKVQNFYNGTGVLTITDLRKTDAGAYSCEAINSKGRVFADRDTQITVLIKDPGTTCNCNNHADRCDSYGRCINCQHYTTGDQCERCQDGYTGDARQGTPYDCQPFKPSPCNPQGTRTESNGRCECMPGYIGVRCDECENNFFNSNGRGCVECFCNGLDVSCTGSEFYYNKNKPSFESSNGNTWKITSLDPKKNPAGNVDLRINQNGNLEFHNLGDFQSEDDLDLYLQTKYLGNKITSYGGNITIKFSYAGRDVDAKNKINFDIRILGVNIAAAYKHPEFLKPYVDHTVVIPLREKNFRRIGDQKAVGRDHLLMTLSDIKYFLIRVKFVDVQYSFILKEFSFDIPERTADPTRSVQVKAAPVEVCACPIGYTGTSCENCAPGFKKSKQGFYLGTCEPVNYCFCNGHSSTCDDQGRCLNCQGNTVGARCESCASGYVRDGVSKCRIDTEIRFNEDSVELRPYVNRTIYVYIYGSVQPTNVYWTKKGDGRLPPNVVQDNFNLVFIDPIPSLAGIYICHVITPKGEVIREIEVRYFDGAPVITFPQVEVIYGYPDQRFQIDCKAIGNPRPNMRIETPSTTISSQAANFQAPRVEGQTENIVTYFIAKLGSDNLGTYRCHASNIHGSVYKDIEVRFAPESFLPPELRIDPRSFDLAEDQPLSINVFLNGTQPISIEVEKYSSPQGPVSYFVYDERTKTLSVNRVTKDMDGIYAVIARNLVGSKLDYFQLRVQDIPPPEITFTQQVIDLNAGSRLDLVPSVRNVRQPQYIWTKDNQQLLSYVIVNQDRLTIPSVSKNDEGYYELTIVDGSGRTTRRVYVRVAEVVVTPAPSVITPSVPSRQTTSPPKRFLVNRDMVITLVEGDNANLVCEPRRDPRGKPYVLKTWYKGRRQHRKLLPQHIKVNHDALMITQVRPGDAADYTCIATRADGTQETIVAQIQVRERADVPREPITAKIVNGELEVEAGGSFELRCTTSGATKVIWLHNNNVIAGNNHFQPQNGRLNVRQFTDDLQGQYTCRAINSFGDAADSTVAVRAAQVTTPVDLPAIRLDEIESEGARREIRCVTNGDRIEWLFNNNPVANNPNLEQRDQTLIIKTIAEGTYTCRAYNSAGYHVDESYVLKAHKPILLEINPRSSNLFVGDQVELTCVVTNQDQANLQFEWTKDGRNIPSNAYQGNNGLLTIRNLEEDNSGEYTCTVTHPETGISNQTAARLEVTAKVDPLKAEIEPMKNIFITGRSGELRCVVEGGKNPTIQWTPPNGALDDRYEVSGNVLRIKQVSQSDRGYFQCTATSGDDSVVSYGLVDIEERISPAVEIFPAGDQRLSRGQSTYAQCRVIAGEPSPTLEWRRADGRAFGSSVTVINAGTVLSIQDIASDDFGTYECVASNSEGDARMSFTILEERSEEPEPQPQPEPQPEPQPQPEVTQPAREPETDTSSDSTTAGGRAPEVYTDNNYFEVNEDDDVQLVCRSNDAATRFEWARDSTQLANGANGVLSLRQVKSEDSGDYSCTGSNGYGSSLAYIRVYVKRVERVSVSIDPKEQAVTVGRSAQFTCNVRNANEEASIQWSKHGGSLGSNHEAISNVLRVNNAQLSDAGRYICTVSVNSNIYYDFANLDVVEQAEQGEYPVFLKVVEKPVLVNGDYRFAGKITLECFTKYPGYVEFSWSREERPIRPIVTVDTREKSSTLNFPAFMATDLGKYTCNVNTTSHVGQNSISFTRTFGNQYKYELSDSVSIPGIPVEQPVRPAEPEERVEPEPTRPEEPTNPVEPAEPTETYTSPEVQILGEKQIEINQGESLELTCNVRGNPRPELEWTRHPAGFPASHRIIDNVLRLENLNEEDSGYYICYGRNSAGENRDYVYVSVIAASQGGSGSHATHGDSGSHAAHGDSGSHATHVESGSHAAHGDSGSHSTHGDSGSHATHGDSGSHSTHGDSGSHATHGDSGSHSTHGDSGSHATHGDSGSHSTHSDSGSHGSHTIGTMDGTHSHPHIQILRQGSLENGAFRLICNLENIEEEAEYEWTRLPNPLAEPVKENVITIYTEDKEQDSGVYTCQAKANNRVFRAGYLMASHDYLTTSNPFASLAVEGDAVIVTARSGLGSKYTWSALSVPKGAYEIDGETLKIKGGQHHDTEHFIFAVNLDHDAELGSLHYIIDISTELINKLLTSTQAITDDSSVITIASEEIETPGSTVELLCPEVNGTVKVYWTRHDSKLKSYGNRLFVTNVQLEDMGKYTCVTYTKDNRRIEKVIYLKPERFGFKTDPSNSTHQVGKTTDVAHKIHKKLPTVKILQIEHDSHDEVHEFECQTSDASLVEWHKLDGEFSSRVKIHKNILKIYNFNKDDYGNYICIASNDHGTEQASIYLGEDYDNYYDAHIDVRSGFNGTVSLTCKAEKPSNYNWYLIVNDENDENKVTKNLLMNTSSIIVPCNQYGVYKCIVKNLENKKYFAQYRLDEESSKIFCVPHITESIEEFIIESAETTKPAEILISSLEFENMDSTQTSTLSQASTISPATQLFEIEITPENSVKNEDIQDKTIELVFIHKTTESVVEDENLTVFKTHSIEPTATDSILSQQETTNFQVDLNKNLIKHHFQTSVILGSTYTTQCIDPNSEHMASDLHYKWSYKNSKSLPARIHINKNLLLINNVTVEDLGSYLCKIYKNTGELITSVEFELQVSDTKIADKKPEIEVKFSPNNGKKIKIGQSFHIECINKSSNILSLKWIRVGKEITQRTILNGNVLKFNKLSAAELGKYSCIATNNIGSTNILVNIDVRNGELHYSLQEDVDIELPKRIINGFIQYKNSSSNVYGGSLRLSCDTGDVESVLSWEKFGESLENIGAANIMDQNTLVIEPFLKSDLGTYICNAKYNNNFESYSFDIDEALLRDYMRKNPTGKNLPIVNMFVNVADNIPVTYGQEFQIICAVDDQTSNITWYGGKFGSSVKIENDFNYYIYPKFQLTIGSLTKEDTKDIYCHATNEAGTSVATLALNQKPENSNEIIFNVRSSKKTDPQSPSILRVVFLSDTTNLYDGDSLTSACIDTTHVNTKVDWLKINSRNKSRSLPSTNIFKINGLNPSHVGYYVCQTSNEAGKSEVYFKIDRVPSGKYVLEVFSESINSDEFEKLEDVVKDTSKLPNIEIKFSDKTEIAEGKRVEMFCESDSDAQTKWCKVIEQPELKFVYITNYRSFLISPILREDFGRYRCVATNKHGSRAKDAVLLKTDDYVDYSIYGYIDHDDSESLYIPPVTSTMSPFDEEDEPDEIKSPSMVPYPVTLNIESTNELNSIKLGQSLELECLPDQEPKKIYWSRPDSNQRFWNVRTDYRVLSIYNFHRNDIGKYQCTAEYPSGNTKSTFLFERLSSGVITGYVMNYAINPTNSGSTVQSIEESSWPQINFNFIKSIQDINLNGKVEIVCSSRSSNTVVEWYKDDRSLNTATLFISKFNDENIGTYTCRALKTTRKGEKETLVGIEFRKKLDKRYEGVMVAPIHKTYFDESIKMKPKPKIDNLTRGYGGLTIHFPKSFSGALDYNSPFEINCTSSDINGTVLWDVPPGSSARIKTISRSFKTLVLRSISEADVGLYKCRLNVNRVEMNKISLNIEQDESGFIVTWTSDKMSPISLDFFSDSDIGKTQINKIIREYDTELYIDCQSSADTRTIWHIDTDNSNGAIEQESRLYFEKIGDESFGKYTCYALPLFQSSGSSRLEITIDKFRNRLVKISYVAYDTDVSASRITSVGSVSYDYPIQNNNEAEGSNRNGDTTNLDNVEKGYNSFERVPQLEIIFEKPKYSLINLGDEVEIVCNSNEESSNMIITWTKNNDEFSENVNIFGEDNEILNINEFNEEDVGIYTCTAVNSDSTSSTSNKIEISIERSPQTNAYEFKIVDTKASPNIDLKYIEPLARINKAKRIEVDCLSSDKTASLEWVKSNPQSGNSIINKNKLIIQPVEDKDLDDYICVAKSTQGSTELILKLDRESATSDYSLTINSYTSNPSNVIYNLQKEAAFIAESKTINEPKSIIKANLMDDVKLICPTINPTSIITWYKIDSQNIKKILNRKHLILKNITNNDFGKYFCKIQTGLSLVVQTYQFYLIKSENLPRFKKYSYSIYDLSDRINDSTSFIFEFGFIPFASQGTLMYMKDDLDKNFMELKINNEQLIYRAKLGNSYEVKLKTYEKLTTGELCKVKLNHENNTVALTLNGKTYKAVSFESLYFTNKQLLLGYNENNDVETPNDSFDGVFHYLKFNDHKVDLFNDAGLVYNIETYDACKYSSCGIGSECVTAQNELGFKCYCRASLGISNCDRDCDKYYDVKECTNVPKYCDINNPCLNNAECITFDETNITNHICDCPIGFKGKYCSITSKIKYIATFNGDGYIELPTDIISKNSIYDDNEDFYLRLTSSKPNGLILTRTQRDNFDFFELLVEDGFVKFKIFNGDDEVKFDSNVRIDDGKLHKIHLKKSKSELTISIGNKIKRFDIPRNSNPNFSPDSKLFVGGYPRFSKRLNPFQENFVGVIHTFYVPVKKQENSYKIINFSQDAKEGRNISMNR